MRQCRFAEALLAAKLGASLKSMNVNERKLRELIRHGEGLTTEFKTCRDQLSRDVYETVCA